ncbi:MAG: efflux RND transporter periplasmic adaptor subunit [Bdellovibrionales bacterium]|nr:efflux RND transporter periplasmic adaptor subunit [Bdellovibrionales bacterium]
MKQILAGAALGGVVLLGYGAIKFFQIQAAIAQHANQGPPPQAVTTGKVEEFAWEQTIPTVGELAPVRGAELTFQSSGVIRKVDFTPGEKVEAGKLLVQLDVTVEQSQLEAAQAELALAEQEYQRYEKLLKNNATSKSEFEKRLSEFRARKAQVSSLQSTIDRRTITAPFNGTLGTQKMALGEYANAGQSVVTLVDLSELYVNFTVPERYIRAVNSGDTIRFHSEAVPDRNFTAQITSIESMIAANTRNISLQARTINEDLTLLPGMFVEVEIVLPETKHYPSIPVSSIQYAPYGNSVFVVSDLDAPDGGKYKGVLPRNVRLGPTKGDKIAVLSGVSVGEEIVTSGTFKLFPTAPVIVNNSVVPGDSFTPNPPNT